jgi:hypothetical protein
VENRFIKGDCLMNRWKIVKRKIIVSIIGTIISMTILILIMNSIYDGGDITRLPLDILTITLWILPVVIFYGIPIQYLSDYLTWNFSN